MTDFDEEKIPLPKFLNELTKNGVPVAKAIAVASKTYTAYCTPSALRQLTDVKLSAAGVSDKQLRRLVLSALRKAGYGPRRAPTTNNNLKDPVSVPGPSTTGSPQSCLSALETITTPTKKRKRGSRSSDKNEFLPDTSTDEAAAYGSLDFNEVLDEQVLKTKSTVINRAPLMTAWATIVAERIGFQREEALSIASVYTEMNAISKGISLGIFDENRSKGIEADKHGSQPYVVLMGRSVYAFLRLSSDVISPIYSALYKIQNGQWRALSNNEPTLPSTAFSYIARSFRQTTPFILGALRLLAATFSPEEINDKGWSLYAEFRPYVDGWGKRGPVSCETILSLRKPADARGESDDNKGDRVSNVVKLEGVGGTGPVDEVDMPPLKKPRAVPLDEYDAVLDVDKTFDDVNVDF